MKPRTALPREMAVRKHLARLRLRAREKTRRLQDMGDILEAAFNALQEGILVIDQEMNVMVLNRYMMDLFGVRDDYRGRKCYEVVQGSLIPCRGTSCRRVMLKGEGEEEELVLIVNGENRIFEVRTYPWKVRGGALKGIIRTFTDVTHRKAVEELQILAGISKYMAHTVRNAIVPIGGYVKLISRECHSEKTARYFAMVEDALGNLEEAVDEYTDFIRVKGEGVCQTLDLMEVIHELPQLLEGEEARKIGLGKYLGCIPLEFHMESGTFVTMGHRELFVRGLLYMVKGGLQVCREFCSGEGRFQIQARVEGGVLVLTDRLMGVEVPESILLTMFQPWVQAAQEPAFHHWSVAIFNEVVKKHGGRLVVKREGGSTLFHARFFKEGLL